VAPARTVRPASSIRKGAHEMTKKLDLGLILALLWLFLHRVVLNWFKHFLGVG
jgi:hypothetical protein